MKHRVVSSCLIWLAISAVCYGAGEYFILYGDHGWSASDENHPVALGLKKFAAENELKCVAFTPEEDWVILFGGNGVWTSNLDLPATKKLVELQKGHDLKCVAFAPGGGWTLLWDHNGSWTKGNVPEDAFKKIVEVSKRGGKLRSIAYGPNGAWVLLFDDDGVGYGNVPPKLAEVLDEAVKKKNRVRCVSFTSRGDWFCLSENGWWTNNTALPVAKDIARLYQEGQKPKWVVVAPQLGPHDFKKWAQVLHTTCDGKIAGGFGFQVRQHGKIVAEGVEGWARAPWEAQHPSLRWTLNKPMGVASVSKTISAVAILKLWEELDGKFSLDDPFWPHIQRICPTANADVKRVTIRQLLQHRSGFPKMGEIESPQALEKLLTAPLAYPPGEHYQYQNVNFYIVRLLIEEIGHVQYTPYVKGHVLKPMGITRMETHAQKYEPMCGYGKDGDKRPGYPFEWNCDDTAGAAGWFASVNDLGMFLEGLRGHRVLNPQTTQMMYKDLLGWDSSNPGWEKNGGWTWDQPPRFGHLSSVIAHFPDDVDAVILANCELPEDIVALVRQAWRQSMQP